MDLRRLVDTGFQNCLLVLPYLVKGSFIPGQITLSLPKFREFQSSSFQYMLMIFLTANNNVATLNAFKQFLNDKFKLKDLGPLKYFLGMVVASIFLYAKENTPQNSYYLKQVYWVANQFIHPWGNTRRLLLLEDLFQLTLHYTEGLRRNYSSILH